MSLRMTSESVDRGANATDRSKIYAWLCLSRAISVACVIHWLPLALLSIPAGQAVTIDGVITPGEWTNAASADIAVAPDWSVHVMMRHDDQYLYLAFAHLRHGGAERYPEILIDPAITGGDAWKPGQWWLHGRWRHGNPDRARQSRAQERAAVWAGV
jgi:hypothetical protein